MSCLLFNRSYQLLLRDYASRQINVLLWISLISITSLLLRKVVKLLKLWAEGNLIPGPPSPSFYGHCPLISRSNIIDVLSKSHEKYGPVVKLWLGPNQLLVSINDPVLIQEMLVKAEDKLPLTGRAFQLAFGHSSLFLSSFDKVQMRRNSMEAEVNVKLLGRAKIVPSKVVDCVMGRIHHVMANGGLECEVVSQYLAFTIMGATLLGDAFLGWSEAAFYEELLMKIAKDACFWASYSVTPFWKRGFWIYHHLCTKLKCLTHEIVQKGKENFKVFCQMDKRSDDESGNLRVKLFTFGSDYLDDKTPDNSFIGARRESRGDLVSVMFHGSLTTAGLIGNILARLATNPEIQEKIYSEIIMVHKVSEKEGRRDVDTMPFLVATIYECARLLPAGPLLQRCSLKHDINLKSGVTIPAGAIVSVPVQLVQMDDSSWGSDATVFNPFRFLSKAEKCPNLVHAVPSTGSALELVDVGQSSYVLNDPNKNAAFLPFGSGARACVGQRLVMLSLVTLFASLLEQYEIRLQPGYEDNPKPKMNNFVLQLHPSPKIVFINRNK